MKNTLHDLNDHLFVALERVNEEGISQKQLDKEIKRAHSVAKIATEIVSNANLQLRAQSLLANGLVEDIPSLMKPKKALPGERG